MVGQAPSNEVTSGTQNRGTPPLSQLSPADLQSFIHSQILQGKNNGAPQKNRVADKFSKKLLIQIETRLKDDIYHEIEASELEISSANLYDFLSNPATQLPFTTFIVSECDSAAYLRCDVEMASLLGFIYLGSEIPNSLPEAITIPTRSEMALLHLFSTGISKALSLAASIALSHVVITPFSELEISEQTNSPMIVFRYQVEIGKIKCGFDLAVNAKYINTEDADDNMVAPTPELLNTHVKATVQLNTKPTTLRTLRYLKVGDCLQLDDASPLKGSLNINGKEQFDGDLGRSGEVLSFRIGKSSSSLPVA